MFLLECKTGIANEKNKELKARLEAGLMNLGYNVVARVINAAEYGVPQVRKRLFYYGWLGGDIREFSLPPPDHFPDAFRSVREAIGDLPTPAAECAEAYGAPQHYLIRTSDVNLKRLRHLPPGGGVDDLPDYLKPIHYRRRSYKGGFYGAYGRLHPDKPSAAIIDGFDSFTRGRFGHPYEDRNITLREGARLQTFPDEFLFEGSQREVTALIGNATPPLLAEKISRAIAGHLRGDFKPLHVPLLPATTRPATRRKLSPKAVTQASFEFTPETAAIAGRRAQAPRASRAAQFHSCFISYSSRDLELAKKIYVDLKAKGVLCWFAPEDLKIGEKFRARIDDEIRTYDKLLLVLSKNSVASTWVEKEVETALEREAERGNIMLFPVRLDDAVMAVKTGWAADIRRNRHIGDFTAWKNKDSYRRAFERLLRDLKVKPARDVTDRPMRQYAAY